MLNQLGSSLVLKFVPLLNFSSTSKSKSISVFLIFSLYYFNMVLLPLIFSVDYRNHRDKYIYLFNENNWYTIFARSIYISLVLTSFLPYIFGPLLGWIYIRCLKKKYPPDFSKRIKVERKYALFLLQSFVIFTFGNRMPFLFLVATLSFTV